MAHAEDALLLLDGPQDGLLSAPAIIEDVVAIGGITTVHMRAGDVALKATRLGMPDDALRPGVAVTVGFRPTCVPPDRGVGR